MAREETKVVLGRGEVYFDLFAAGTRVGEGERYIGNTTTFQVSRSIERVERATSYRGQKISKEGSIVAEIHTVQFITDHIDIENVALWFGGVGVSDTYSGVSVVTENIVVRRNRFYQLGRSHQLFGTRAVENVVVKIAGTVIAASGNYEVEADAGRIHILKSAPSIPNNSTLTVLFEWRATTREIAKSEPKDLFGSLRFLATNPIGPKRNYYFPFVQISPRGQIDIKGDEWQQLPFDVAVKRLNPNTAQVYIDSVTSVGLLLDDEPPTFLIPSLGFASTADQIVRGLDIYSDGDQVTLAHRARLTQSRQRFKNGRGIFADQRDDILLADLDLAHVAHPMSAVPHHIADMEAIYLFKCKRPRLINIKTAFASSGASLVECEDIYVNRFIGINPFGDYPRGQVIQFNKCHNITIGNIYGDTDHELSFVEDLVSFFECTGTLTIFGDWFLRGNNSQNGWQIMGETSTFDEIVVIPGIRTDLLNVGCGGIAFAGTPNGKWGPVRVRDGHATGVGGRPAPSSGSLAVGAFPFSGEEAENTTLHVTHYNIPNPLIYYDAPNFTEESTFVELDFTPFDPLVLEWGWQDWRGGPFVIAINGIDNTRSPRIRVSHEIGDTIGLIRAESAVDEAITFSIVDDPDDIFELDGADLKLTALPEGTEHPLTLRATGARGEHYDQTIIVESVNPNTGSTTGAVEGVLGSGGSFPPSWQVANVTGLITSIEILDATHVVDGVECTDIRVITTATTNFVLYVPDGYGQTDTATGDRWRGDCYVQVLSGTGAQDVAFSIYEIKQAGFVLLGEYQIEHPPLSTSGDFDETLRTGAFEMLNAETDGTTLGIYFGFEGAADTIIRFSASLNFLTP